MSYLNLPEGTGGWSRAEDADEEELLMRQIWHRASHVVRVAFVKGGIPDDPKAFDSLIELINWLEISKKSKQPNLVWQCENTIRCLMTPEIPSDLNKALSALKGSIEQYRMLPKKEGITMSGSSIPHL